MTTPTNRRNFVKTAALTAFSGAGVMTLSSFSKPPLSVSQADEINIIGPKEGFTPHIGSLASMLNWMRFVMLRSVDGMTTDQLDFLLDSNANSIGSMLFHLAATDKFYYLHTFKNIDANHVMDSPEFSDFKSAMELGDAARKTIRGNNLDYYLDILRTTREETLNALANKDDEWLLNVDNKWPWGPTNNYCKWFHVCEHESNHNGQIKLIKSRIS